MASAPEVTDNAVGIGYTLATSRLFCDFSTLHAFAEKVLDRPVLTHEFGEETVWHRLREAYEAQVTPQ